MTSDALSNIVESLRKDLSLHAPSDLVLSLPRRKHASIDAQTKAKSIAEELYPNKTPLEAIIQYEKDITSLRAKYLELNRTNQQKAWEAKGARIREAIKSQGVYDYRKHQFATPAALPMPVQIAQKDELQPLFDYLKSNHTMDRAEDDLKFEPNFGIEMQEFRRGVVYADQRMDLCKMVVGPKHIETLMDCLDSNFEIQHFLLGNNIIGPNGAKSIARYIQRHPNRIKTWYLAGNMIDAPSFLLISQALSHSDQVSAIWLKRNPLGPTSVQSIATVLKTCHSLKTLDLDQTELTGLGVQSLFKAIRSIAPILALRTVYLNGNGVEINGISAIANFLSEPECHLENLYLANNPIADVGAFELAHALGRNKSLKRLSLSSCGIGAIGSAFVAKRLLRHPNLIRLDLSQSFATFDLGSCFNYIDGKMAFVQLQELIKQNSVLRCLELGITGFSVDQVMTLKANAANSSVLWFFTASSTHARIAKSKDLSRRLEENVRRDHGVSYNDFLINGLLRKLKNPDDVRAIDSIYRNRDFALARSGQKELQKQWENSDLTMKNVMEYKSA